MESQNINWTWNDDGSLSMWNNVDAMRQHPVTGENIWFNQVTASHCSYYKAHPSVSRVITQSSNVFCQVLLLSSTT